MRVTQIDKRLLISSETEFEEEFLVTMFQGKDASAFLKCGTSPEEVIGVIINPVERKTIEEEEDERFLKFAKNTIPKARVIHMVDDLEGVARSAVGYVGSANYKEREMEALERIGNKVKEIMNEINS